MQRLMVARIYREPRTTARDNGGGAARVRRGRAVGQGERRDAHRRAGGRGWKPIIGGPYRRVGSVAWGGGSGRRGPSDRTTGAAYVSGLPNSRDSTDTRARHRWPGGPGGAADPADCEGFRV